MTMSDQAEIERLRAEVAALRADQKLTLKVSPKGALSVYGLQRFPVTLYREQWERLLEAHAQIQAFIAANGGALKTRGS